LGKILLPRCLSEQLASRHHAYTALSISSNMICHKPNMFALNSIFSNCGHLGRWIGSLDIILKGDHPRTIPPKFGPSWPSRFRGEDFLLIFWQNYIFLAMAAILVGGRRRRIYLWKGTSNGPFHQSLVPVGHVVSEEKIFNWFFAEFFYFLPWRSTWWAGITLKGELAQWFQRRRYKCEKLTDDRRRTTTDA
jgi:hypothetical protein